MSTPQNPTRDAQRVGPRTTSKEKISARRTRPTRVNFRASLGILVSRALTLPGFGDSYLASCSEFTPTATRRAPETYSRVRLTSDGVAPYTRRKARLKCDKSPKPTS